MPLSFPSSPSVGQKTTQNNREYTWDGYAWNLSSNIGSHASTHGSTGADPVTVQVAQISDLAAGANAALRMYLWQNFR